VLPFLALALLGAMRQLDGALAARHLPGFPGRGLLEFPTLLSGERVETVRRAVSAWYAATPDDRFADGLELARRIILLDVAFIVVYAVGLGLLIAARLNRPTDRFWPEREKMLQFAAAGLVALVVLDIVEDVLAWHVVSAEWGAAASDGDGASSLAIETLSVVTTFKLLVVVLVLVPLAVGAFRRGSQDHREVVKRLRIIVLVLVMLAVLLLLGIGGEQTAEVVRAWDAGKTVAAGVGAGVLALTTWAAARLVTAPEAWVGRPETAEESEIFVAIAGIVLLGIGIGLGLLPGWSRALAVPGGLLLVIAALSFPIVGAYSVLPAPGDQERRDRVHLGRLWARGLAAGTLLLAALVALRAAAFEALGRDEILRSRDAWEFPLLFAVVCLAGAVCFLVLRLRPRPRLRIGLAAAGAIVLLGGAIALFTSPLAIGTAVGSYAVIGWAFAALLVVLAAATLLGLWSGERFRLPAALAVLGLKRFPTVAFVVAWFVLASVVDKGGYHDVRLGAERDAENVTLTDAWNRWVERNVTAAPAEGDRPAVPLILVATAGGGIRAAAWTSLALDCIFRRLPNEEGEGAHCPSEPAPAPATAPEADLFFAAGGTSGGSVGLVQYDAALRAEAADGAVEAKWVEDRLGADFVAPNLAGLLFRDLPRAFLGFDAPDRAELLERAWEDRWEGGELAQGLRETWVAEPEADERLRPLLLLNGTSAEDGCRFMTSVMRPSIHARDLAANDDCLRLKAYGPGAGAPVADTFLPATTDLADFLCDEEDVRLSTAALLSARFAFVSPSGRLTASECSEPGEEPKRYAPAGKDAATFVIDGGYFDNSGARVLVDMWRNLEPRVAAINADEARSCVVPVFVQLDNDGDTEPSPGPDPRPKELTIPAAAILAGIGSHETSARAVAAATFDRPAVLAGRDVRAGVTPVEHFWIRLAPRAHPGPSPPLGWALSDTSFEDMRTELAADYNQGALGALAQLMSGNLTCGAGS
jgi:hypothetical protein